MRLKQTWTALAVVTAAFTLAQTPVAQLFAEEKDGGTFAAEGPAPEPDPGAVEADGGEVTTAGTPRRLESWDLPYQEDKQFHIKKIYDFLNDPKITKTGQDKSLAYEFKYFNYGAITKDQIRSRQGQYYVVTWANTGQPADMQLRLDYRQQWSGDEVRTLTIDYPSAKGTFKGKFAVTGDMYERFGLVNSWRISLVRDGKIVAQEKSFVW